MFADVTTHQSLPGSYLPLFVTKLEVVKVVNAEAHASAPSNDPSVLLEEATFTQ